MDNFLPNVRCPHCGKVRPVSISGFGGELNIREKRCPHCGRDYKVAVLVTSHGDIPDSEADGAISELKSRLKWLRQQRKKNAYILYMQVQEARRILEESEELAKRMAEEYERKKDLN